MAEDVFGIVGTTQPGNFRVERVVAEGGYGVVYRALHGGFRAPVALKCLKLPASFKKEEFQTFLEKFRAEAEVMFRLSQSIPQVVRPLTVDAWKLPGGRYVPFIALEWLDGESLDVIVDRRADEGKPPLPLTQVIKMLQPIAGALVTAHNFRSKEGTVSIIHRDVKPENLIWAEVNGEQQIKILDFGIAKIRDQAHQVAGKVTAEQDAAFTPQYASPEQWLPKRFGATGTWTDVWGLAITIVEIIIGRPPIDGETTAMLGTIIDEKRRPTPKREGAHVSDEVDEVFRKALAVDPRRRYQDVATFWTDLERAVGLPTTLVDDDGGARERPHRSASGGRPLKPPPPKGRASIGEEADLFSAADDDDLEADLDGGFDDDVQSALESEAPPPASAPEHFDSRATGERELAGSSGDLDMHFELAVAPKAASSAHRVGETDRSPGKGAPRDLDVSSGSHKRPAETSVVLAATGSLKRPTDPKTASGRNRVPDPPPEPEEPPSLGKQLAIPISLALLGLTLAVLDSAVLQPAGIVVAVGDYGLAWLAIPLGAAGIVWGIWKLLQEAE